jgi:hypothetical protein
VDLALGRDERTPFVRVSEIGSGRGCTHQDQLPKILELLDSLFEYVCDPLYNR